MTNEPIYSFAALRNRLTINGVLEAQTALRVGAGRDLAVLGNDLPVLRDGRGNPLIPGASLKGAFRARLEALVRSVHSDQARDLLEIEEHMRWLLDWRERDQEFLRVRREEGPVAADRAFSQQAWTTSTLIDLTFGSPWSAGRIFFRDALVDPTLWFGQFEVRNGVGIDRDTETVAQSLLYNYEVVPAGMRFGFALTLENAAPWQIGMVLLGLEPWQRGEAQIGGFRSRGLGYLQLLGPDDSSEPAVSFIEVRTPDDVIALLEDRPGQHPASKEQRQAWREAFVAVLRDPKEAHKELGNA
ncbi:MAG TPA: CRISPR-associated RAMP protein Csx7 [Roseiflexaceae bacterium]|nr:CRISPR-associated RAMP protein Csx7 [Roseiflexaceae bacterium]